MNKRYIYYGLYDSPYSYTNDFIAATGLSDINIIAAMRKYEKDMKVAGIIDYANPANNKLKAIYFNNLGSAGLVKYNWLDPRDLDSSFRQTPNGGIIYDNAGAKLNGINGYFDTHLNCLNDLYSLNNSFSVYLQIEQAESMSVLGGYSAPARLQLYPRNTDGKLYLAQEGFEISQVNTSSLGLFQGSKINNSTVLVGIRGAVYSKVNGPIANKPMPNQNFKFGTLTYGAFSSNKITYGTLGKMLTSVEMIAHYNAIQNYCITLGIAV